MAIQQGIAYWASVRTPNTKFEPCYTVDLVVSDEVANDFESRGFRVKDLTVNDEVVGRSINFKRKVNGPNGMVRKAPLLMDADKVPMDENVGNGSKVRVQYNEYSGEGKFGPYVGLDLQAVQVVDLIEYKNADGAELLADGEEF